MEQIFSFASPSGPSSSSPNRKQARAAQPQSCTFRNALLVGYPANSLYSVTVADGLVTSITSSDLLGAESESDQSIIDLRGQTYVGPSLVDHHVHFSAWATSARRLDLGECKSAASVFVLVKEWLARPSSGEEHFIVAQKMRVGEWPDLETMSRVNLDKLESVRPLVLFFAGFHSLCANTVALKVLGHDPQGHTGILLEAECFAAWSTVNDIEEDLLDRWVDEAARQAAMRGLTEIVELEMSFNIKAWKRRYRKGTDVLRVRCGLYDKHLSDAIQQGFKSGDIVPETDGLLTVGPYKIITDGSLGSLTAYCHDCYPNTQDHGLFTYPRKTLASMVAYGVEHGFTLAVHAIGDKANSITLETLDFLSTPPPPGSSIEHAQLLTRSDFSTFKKLGLIASIQPRHAVDDKELCDRYWEGRTDRAFPFKSLADAGVVLKLGSDAPVAAIDPWDAMAVAISRTSPGMEDKPGYHVEQCITIEQAWCASTSNGRAMITVGDRADLVFLEQDPLQADARGLRAMVVIGTMLGGRWTFKTTKLDM